MAEVVIWKLLDFLVVVGVDIAGIPKGFCEDGMNLYSNIPAPEDLPAGLQGPLVGRHQHQVNIFLLQLLPGSPALLLPLLSNAAIDEFPSIRYFLVEILKLNALIPSQITVICCLVLQKPAVEVGLCMPDEDDVLGEMLHGYC